jgi:hypothetical protein
MSYGLTAAGERGAMCHSGAAVLNEPEPLRLR